MPLIKSFAALPLDVVRGEDVYVFDATGRRYLDFYAGHAVASTGHCHPKVVKAIQDQAAQLIFYSSAVGHPLRETASDLLLSFAPKSFTHTFFANSGAEANENALKMARRHTNRTGIISMNGSFHGRTAGAISVTGSAKYRAQAQPLVPDITFVDFGNLEATESAISDRTAAIILEPIQSMAGIKTAAPEYFQGLRSLCDQNGSLLIYDEVQTGIGRTGTMFFAGRHGVVPDLITLAKGIASGFPLSAVLVRDEIAARIGVGEYGATFGAGPLAMAAMKATLEVLRDEHVLQNVSGTGMLLEERLSKCPGVVEVRGAGFLLGVKTDLDAKLLQKKLLEAGILVGTADEPGVLRLLPPLTLRPSHVIEFESIFRKVVAHELQGSALH